MKAKEWVKRLCDLSSESPEFESAVNELLEECNAILRVRAEALVSKRPAWLRPDKARWANAFREANVKWDAVVHGVTIRVKELNGPDTLAPFPLFKGMPLWMKLSQAVEDAAAGASDTSEAFIVLRDIAINLGYQDVPAFKIIIDQGRRVALRVNLNEYLQVSKELMQYREKMLSGHLNMTELNRLCALRMRWNYLTQELGIP